MMAYGRYQPSSSPWASGAPPMYGSSGTHVHTHLPSHAHNAHTAAHTHAHTHTHVPHVAHVPPPQYPQTSYGHSSPNAWNPTPAPQMRQTGWSPQNAFTHTMHHMQHNQQRGGIRPMVGPTGKRVNMGIGWDAPPNKKFAKSNRGGGSGGGSGGAMSGQNNWRQTHKFHNQRQNRDKRNNREINRVKQQNDNQKERRQQHDMAQKVAESLDKKEYSIDQTANKQDSDANKSLEIDSVQEKYVLAVFGYVCQICNVFVKDKSARYEHCQSEEHLTKFNSMEEEAKKETEKKPEAIKSIPEDTVANTNESKSELTDTVENGDTNVKNENKDEDAIEKTNEMKTNETNEITIIADETIIKDNQKEENKDNEDTDEDNEASKPNDESGGKGLSRDEISQPLQSCNDNVNPNPTDVNKALDANPQSDNNFITGDYSIGNRGRGSYARGRANQGRGGSPRGRGRNRGRGRK